MALTQIPGVLVQFELSGPLFGGMSGVVYGLFGFTWMQARYASRGYALNDQDTLWIMGWFVLCATGLVGRIANAQHALGLVFGLLAGMPAYVAFRRSSAALTFEKGSWADLNIRGFQRFRRAWFDPYVPALVRDARRRRALRRLRRRQSMDRTRAIGGLRIPDHLVPEQVDREARPLQCHRVAACLDSTSPNRSPSRTGTRLQQRPARASGHDLLRVATAPLQAS